MAKYKLLKNIDGVVSFVTCEVPPFTKTIPFAEDNTDYQEYLEWVAAGNTAEAAD
tara:strand:+ start:65 stop:229 length:165 start_codon:yes stop_codon:yes gene_type:complete